MKKLVEKSYTVTILKGVSFPLDPTDRGSKWIKQDVSVSATDTKPLAEIFAETSDAVEEELRIGIKRQIAEFGYNKPMPKRGGTI